MPYITQKQKDDLEEGALATTAGELNYQFTMLAKKYFEVRGRSYQTINDIIGALEGAKLEFYRRVAAPYENEKIEQNGDVYQ